MIYLDNAATTLHKPKQVIDAVVTAMTTYGNSSRGAHGTSLSASRGIYGAREKAAAFFGLSRPDHVVFTSNSTEALNIAISGTLSKGDHVITTELEHNSVLRPLYRLEETGIIELSFVKADRQGIPDYEDFEKLIRPETKAIVSTHASNLTGNIVDIERVGRTAKAHGLLFIVDASQTAGAVPINMEKQNIDILCFTGHKSLMGPQGTGGLLVREGIKIRPFKVGGSGIKSYLKTQPEEMPVCLEAGTLNGHGIAGLSAAFDYINEVGTEAIREKEMALASSFLEGIKDVEGVVLYGDPDMNNRTAIVTLNIGDVDSAVLADDLAQEYDIAVRAGAHCAPKMHEALGTVEQGAVRFSFSWFNTEEEVEKAVQAVKELAADCI